LSDDIVFARHLAGGGKQRRLGQQREADPLGQDRRRAQVSEGHAGPADPVDVGRTDAAAGGADRRAAAGALGRLVERGMKRKDDLRAVGDRDA